MLVMYIFWPVGTIIVISKTRILVAIVSAMASFFMPVFVGVGKIPIPYKIAILQKCEIVIWIGAICSFQFCGMFDQVMSPVERIGVCFGKFGEIGNRGM